MLLSGISDAARGLAQLRGWRGLLLLLVLTLVAVLVHTSGPAGRWAIEVTPRTR